MKKIKNILRTFKGFKSKKLRTSQGFLQFQCSYKKKTCTTHWLGENGLQIKMGFMKKAV